MIYTYIIYVCMYVCMYVYIYCKCIRLCSHRRYIVSVYGRIQMPHITGVSCLLMVLSCTVVCPQSSIKPPHLWQVPCAAFRLGWCGG